MFVFSIVANVTNHYCVRRLKLQRANVGARSVVVDEIMVQRIDKGYTAIGGMSAASAGEGGVITATVDIGP